MDLQHLRYAVEVEQSGSITQAAKNLYMGQPNLSKAIAELEKEIGVVLFARTAQGVRVTPEGTCFLQKARSILKEVETLTSQYRGERQLRHLLHVTASHTVDLSRPFADFIGQTALQDACDISLSEREDTAVLRDVSNGTAQLGVLRCRKQDRHQLCELLTHMHLEFQSLATFTMGVLTASALPFKGDATLQMLSHGIEIQYGNVNRVESLQPGPAKRRVQVDDRAALYMALTSVRDSYAWAAPLLHERPEGLCFYTIAGAPEAEDFLIHKKAGAAAEDERAFLDLLNRYYRQPRLDR